MELREEIRSEKERLRADNIMWEQQNSELEAERTRLLQALRTQGKQLVFVLYQASTIVVISHGNQHFSVVFLF